MVVAVIKNNTVQRENITESRLNDVPMLIFQQTLNGSNLSPTYLKNTLVRLLL